MKDNLARRQCLGDRKCCFYVSDETIQYLFFDCHFAKFIWRVIHVSFNLKPPISVQNYVTGWSERLNRKIKSQILMGPKHGMI